MCPLPKNMFKMSAFQIVLLLCYIAFSHFVLLYRINGLFPAPRKDMDDMKMLTEGTSSPGGHISSRGIGCPDVPIIIIPNVMKGLNNQRMRIVQDIAASFYLGAAVVLPVSSYSRKGCGYRSNCYKDYILAGNIWSIYDQSEFIRAIGSLGVRTVMSGDCHFEEQPTIINLTSPFTVDNITSLVEFEPLKPNLV